MAEKRWLTYQRRLARALYTVQSHKEWRWRLTLTLKVLTMLLQSLEDEGHAMLRLVIDDRGHGSGLCYGHATCGTMRL